MAVQWTRDQEEVRIAKEAIGKEFLQRFDEFLHDVPNGESRDFGKKYGFTLTQEGIEEHKKDTIKNLMWFQSRVFSGRYLPDWERQGFNRYVIWDLANQGFLSNQEFSNYQARATGRTSFYYISQKVAKELYKDAKRA